MLTVIYLSAKNCFVFSFPILISHFILFFIVARTSSTVLNRNGDDGHLGFIRDFKGMLQIVCY